jgi:transcriptional pleiotropic regulator of transition state genes
MAKEKTIDLRSEARAVGTARRIDQLGRVVVPAELRKMMGIENGDLLDFRFVDGHIVILRLETECALCGSSEDLTPFDDKHVCAACIEKLRHQPECAICGGTNDLFERHGKHVCQKCAEEISLV